MRGLMKDIFISMAMGLVLPGVVLNFAVMLLESREELPVASVEECAQTVTQPGISLPMRLRQPDGTTSEEDMDAYLVGVVLAEMPAYFENEALKAQAVVARTYTRKAYTTGGKHGDGSICTQPSCCQAYITEADYLAQGGTQENVDRVCAAVFATSGQVLTYGGELIEATYFSSAGGSTEDAVAVWGTDFPYLRSVASPDGEDAADTRHFTRQQLEEKLGLSLAGPSNTWFTGFTYTAGGGVASVTVAGQTFSGTKLRSLLGLRSTVITVIPEDDAVTVTTRGYGHRVGMSQYGADAMAASGSSYADILAHYYPGTILTEVEN